ncbi:hypothetical protein Ancab_031392 [Ancistrocladus abbreviatus]
MHAYHGRHQVFIVLTSARVAAAKDNGREKEADRGVETTVPSLRKSLLPGVDTDAATPAPTEKLESDSTELAKLALQPSRSPCPKAQIHQETVVRPTDLEKPHSHFCNL